MFGMGLGFTKLNHKPKSTTTGKAAFEGFISELPKSKEVLIIFYKDGERSAGIVSEDVYYDKLFPIFRDHLRPLSDVERSNLTLEMKSK